MDRMQRSPGSVLEEQGILECDFDVSHLCT